MLDLRHVSVGQTSLYWHSDEHQHKYGYKQGVNISMSMDKDQGGNDGKIIMGECFGMNVNDSEVIIWHEYE